MALATLGLTVVSEGKHYAALEARSMIAGAAALLFYTVACVYFIGVRRARSASAAFTLLAVWAICALALWSVWLR